MSVFHGSVDIKKMLTVGRRLNEGCLVKTLTSDYQLTSAVEALLLLSAESQFNVLLPDATALPRGWAVEITNDGTATLAVQASDSSAIKNVVAGRSYRLKLLDNSTTAGEWRVNFLEEADMLVSERYVYVFDATSSWGTASGGTYTLPITAATHGRGVNPIVVLYKSIDGSSWQQVFMGTGGMVVDDSGNVSLIADESPDCRFSGYAVLI